jgi:hypothetical protein
MGAEAISRNQPLRRSGAELPDCLINFTLRALFLLAVVAYLLAVGPLVFSPVARLLAKASVGLACAAWVVAKDGSNLPDTALLVVYTARALLVTLLFAAIPEKLLLQALKSHMPPKLRPALADVDDFMAGVTQRAQQCHHLGGHLWQLQSEIQRLCAAVYEPRSDVNVAAVCACWNACKCWPLLITFL